MTSIDCDEYVDMGEHNKPLCKKSGYRPAECELCPTRVASLEAENAKLRKAMDFQALELGCMTDNRDVLYLENEKLRELITDVHEALRADKAGMFHKLILANMEDDMRELGIEVD